MPRGPQARRERERAALRDKICEAARQLFEEEGHAGVSLRRIADRIEYSPTTIYLYFKDKNELLLLLIQDGFSELHERMSRGKDADPETTIRQSAYAYLDFARERPHYYRLMFQLDDPALIELRAQQAEKLSALCFSYVLEAVQSLRAQGRLNRYANDTLVAHLIWGQMHGAASLMLANLLDWLDPAEQEAYPGVAVDGLVTSLLS